MAASNEVRRASSDAMEQLSDIVNAQRHDHGTSSDKIPSKSPFASAPASSLFFSHWAAMESAHMPAVPDGRQSVGNRRLPLLSSPVNHIDESDFHISLSST